ncbi:hypothetical protein Tdes44962_MAKER06082 [Teratosphaeria destructans]|uniref:Uncharacterized protein n=1 Tax=Teratosphaeria destructans TaxID=418781 RepID=A0A9W7SI89_9PEZI|nr:hypothetical protein Tdes44962_MAKER06082 [Teratosphaeria destructans]
MESTANTGSKTAVTTRERANSVSTSPLLSESPMRTSPQRGQCDRGRMSLHVDLATRASTNRQAVLGNARTSTTAQQHLSSSNANGQIRESDINSRDPIAQKTRAEGIQVPGTSEDTLKAEEVQEQ